MVERTACISLAAGLSIFGTQLSAITFMAIPAKSFATDWTWIMMNMTIVAVAPFIVLLFLPFYRRLNVTTAYEYIEKRFNVVVRLTASAMFMVFQFARIGIVLYLPSIALSVVTGVDIKICIAVMGFLSITYTVMGGIEAVIWTDVVQVFILLGGLFILAIFTRRANTVHDVMFAATGMMSCFVIGYMASLIISDKDRDLTGLTLYSLKKKEIFHV
jgi:Na+/proline symporter